MPLRGLWYRPWLRRATYALFVSVTVFSMVMGFYDLLKNVPFLHQARFRRYFLVYQTAQKWVH